MLFEDMVEGWFSDETVPYNDFLKAFLAKDLDYMNEYMNRVAEATFSTFDTGRNPSDDTNPERFYHGFVLGLIVKLAGKYRVTSNRESGFVDTRQRAGLLNTDIVPFLIGQCFLNSH